MGEMVCLCREINKSTGEIAVYPLKAEVTDRLLSLRQRVNPELKYFVTLAANYDANEEAILKELHRKQITDRLISVLNLVQL